MDPIYLDNNASTPTLPAVVEAMLPHLAGAPGNPSSGHHAGRRARRALEDAREQTAALLGAAPDEVVFTSGATEANNLAVLGLIGDSPGRLLLSPVEHPCVIEPARRLAARGIALDWLPVDAAGAVIAEGVTPLLHDGTRLVSVMLANHETGTVQPVRAVVEQVGAVPVHCDAAAAAGKMPIHFGELGVTTLTVSAHKFHGPQGVGALVVRRGTALQPLFWGGHQQQGRRPGTEPVALAVGLAVALRLAHEEAAARRDKVLRLRRLFLESLRREAAPLVLNGLEVGGLPHTVNLSFPGCAADLLLMNLDLAGVACSTGSACSSGSLLPSQVLRAMGVPDAVLRSAMRFSLGHLLSEDEVAEAASRVVSVVSRLRRGAAG